MKHAACLLVLALFPCSPALAQDLDGDGWGVADGDCCDAPTLACPFPQMVNPGAVEVPSNLLDDDCDGLVDEAPPFCSPGSDLTATGLDLAGAMELCETTTAAPPLAQKRWGVISAQLLYADGSSAGAYSFALQTAVKPHFGTGGILPLQGSTLAALSSGTARAASDPGFFPPYPGTDHGHLGNPPASYLAAHAGLLPVFADCLSGGGACAQGSGANDSVNLRLSIRVPTNAQGFSFRHRFLASDYGTYLCSQYGDFALGLLQSAAPGLPADRNIMVDSQGEAVSLNSADFLACKAKLPCYPCPLGVGPLAGTGYELPSGAAEGAATEWTLASAAVVPGEVIVLELMVWDTSDPLGDGLLLLDGFAWDLVEPDCATYSAAEVVRLGTPPNPAALLPGQTSGPIIGATWDPVIDHAAFMPDAILDFLAVGLAPTSIPSPLGTFLCGLAPPLVITSPAGVPFFAPIPNECVHVGKQLYTQGGSVNASIAIQLANALDIAFGTF